MAGTDTPAITILYFAAVSTATGRTSETVTLPIDSATDTSFRLSSLGALLVSRYPNTDLDEILQTSQWSVDAEMVDNPEEVVLRGGEEVAIICPVSGG
jgi:molybdopterin synthase sulfur carrier subunit